MGFFDLFKSTPDYVIHDVQFYGGRLEPSGKAKFSTDVEWGSYYLFPRLDLTVNRQCEVLWRVVILRPDGKKLQGKTMPEGIATEYKTKLDKTGKIFLTCPGFGDRVDIPYLIGGSWHWFLYDENDNILISKAFYITSPETSARENAYMHITDIEFATNRQGPYMAAEQLKPDSSTKYLYARARYGGIYGSIETDVELDIEIVRPDGHMGKLATKVHVNPSGGEFNINGYGNDKRTWFIDGDYQYRICYKGKTLFTKKFTVIESLEDRCFLDEVEVEWGQDIDSMKLWEHLYLDSNKPQPTLDKNKEYTVWIKAKNYAESDQSMYLKIASESGGVVRLDSDTPEGYTGKVIIKANFTATHLFCQALCQFSFVDPQSAVGTYTYSIWCKNRRGQMKCLYAGRKTIK